MSNINLDLKYGQLSTIPSSVVNGRFLVATDKQQAFVDVNSVRVPLTDLVTGKTATQITAQTAGNFVDGKIYVASDTLALYWYDSTASEWKHMNDWATKDASGNVITTTYETKTDATTKYNDLLSRIGDASFDVSIVADEAHLPGNSGDPTGTPSTHTIYFVPANAIVTDPDKQYYDEWMWIITTPADPTANPPVAAVGRWEKIGTTETELTNYYTKTEVDDTVGDIYTALGITEGDQDEASYVSFDSRLDEIEAQIGGTMDPSSTTGFVSIDGRLDSLETRATTTEGDVDEIQAQIGEWYNSQEPDFISIADKIQATDDDLTEIHAQIGSLDSTATGYIDIATRLSTLESAGSDDAAAIDELEAKFGSYAASTDTGFVSVEDRFAELEGKFGAYAATDATGFVSVEARFTADETAISGAESDIDEIQAQLGSYPASTATDFVSVADRFSADETAISGAESDIDELQAQLGSYPASTATDFVSVADRFTADEADIAELQAKFGAYAASTASEFISVESRFQTNETAISGAESDIDELQAQLGNYAASTATGFVSVEARFSEIEAKIGAMDPSTTTGFQTIEERLSAIEAGALNQSEDLADAEKPVLVSGNNAHTTVEYVSNVTVNAETGGVTANQITLGDAVLTFNSTTGALEINF